VLANINLHQSERTTTTTISSLLGKTRLDGLP